MTYDITEVPAYRTADGRVIAAAELTEITAYRTDDGTLYLSKEEARKSLLNAAFRVVGDATADEVAAAHAGTNQTDLLRLALRYITATMDEAA